MNLYSWLQKPEKKQRRKGKKRKGRFSYKQEHEDPEIQAEWLRNVSQILKTFFYSKMIVKICQKL